MRIAPSSAWTGCCRTTGRRQLGTRVAPRGDEMMICPNMRAAQIYVRHPTPERAIESDRERDAEGCARGPGDVADRADAAGRRGLHGRPRIAGGSTFSRATGVRDSAPTCSGARGRGAGTPARSRWSRTAGRSSSPTTRMRSSGSRASSTSTRAARSGSPRRRAASSRCRAGEAHVGGASHGALHKLDSLSPVIVAGGTTRHDAPARTCGCVDIAPLCMQLLGIPMRYKVGDPRRAVLI